MARRVTTRETKDAAGRRVDTVERDDALETYDRTRKGEDVVWFILAIILTIVGVRFLLLLLGAKTGTAFVDFWYNLSAPFVRPFAGIFGNTDTYTLYTGSRLELESLVAMLIYSLLAYLIVMGIRLISRPAERS